MKIEFTIPAYYTIIGFLTGKSPDKLLLSWISYWVHEHPKSYLNESGVINEKRLPAREAE